MLSFIFCLTYIMLQFHMFIINMDEVSNDDINVCKSNPCVQKGFRFQAAPNTRFQIFFFLLLRQAEG